MITRREFVAVGAAAFPFLSPGLCPRPAVARPAGVKRLRITRVHTVEVRDVPTGKGLVLPWDPKKIPHDTRDYVVAQLFTDQGVIGTAMDGEYKLPAGVGQTVRERAEAYFVGKDPFDIEAHNAAFFQKQKSPARLFFLEVGLWDIIGKVCGQPLHRLWGTHSAKVPAYAATVHFLKTPKERAEDAGRAPGRLATRLAAFAPPGMVPTIGRRGR